MKKINSRKISRQIISPVVIGALLTVMALFTLSACNESGGGLFAGGGIGGTGISVGEISGFGSVIVNDVDFDTRKAKVIVNGKAVGGGDSIVRNMLALGMVVRVEGKIIGNGTGKADRIVFNENVKGPVSNIEPLDSIVKKVVVLGQIIIVDDRTQFKDTGFDSLAVGNVLQISGWSDGSGIIRATYIAKIEAPDEEVTVKGIISEVNVPQKNLRINQLNVDFSQADLKDFPDDMPAVDQLVIVKGFLDANGVLVATQVSLENDLGRDDADDVEIEGVVSKFSSPENFALGTTNIQTDEATEFKGIEPSDIFVGVRLLIKGSLRKGFLLADEVIAKDKVNIEGNVKSVDYGQDELLLGGLDPLVVHINDITKIFGNANTADEIKTEEHVKILGYVAGQDEVEAIQVKVEKKLSDKVKLQGPVTGKENSTVFVFNVAIDLTKIENFETDTEGSVSRDRFLNKVTVGDTVIAKGNLIGDLVEWKGIELLR